MKLTGGCVLILTLAFSSGLFAATEKIGEREFQMNCAVCHGADAKGNGPMVEWLTIKPKSLRTLAKANNGVFPWQRVYGIIDGSSPVKPHGTTDMPVWGDRYAQRAMHEEGEYGAEHPATVRARILELVFYLAAIQE